MTNKTIPDLAAGTAPDGTEVIETVQAGVSVKLTADDLLTRADGTPLNITAAGTGGDVNIFATGDGAITIEADGNGVTINSDTAHTIRLQGGHVTVTGSANKNIQVGASGSGFISLQTGATGDIRLEVAAGKLINLTADAWAARAVTVANLPAAATAGVGARAFVTDASTTVILGLGLTVTGSGANKVPVYSDGTNWKIG